MKERNGMISFVLLLFFLFLTDFFSGILYIIDDTNMLLEQILRPSIQMDALDLQKQLLIFNTYQIKADNVDVETTTGTVKEKDTITKKTVYIYNTHQTEKYSDGKTVVDASIYLAELLEKNGIRAVVELSDFTKYAKSQGYGYDGLYDVSRYYFKEALAEYGNFDYVIDLHRDGVGNANTSIVYKNQSFAKMMFVVSLASVHGDIQYAKAADMTKQMNQSIKGIGKNINKKYYTIFNQDVLPNVFLIEMGSNNNTFDEVKNSLEVFADMLSRR